MVHVMQKVQSKISFFESIVAGGTAGAITRAVAQPLDVLKIRFQLQIEPIAQGSKYSSIYQALNSIVKDEGVSTLWSGHVPAQLLSISFGIVQFSTFEKLSQLCQTGDSQFYNTYKHWINFCNGGFAAGLATLISFPFDTVRTRLIAEQKTKRAYKGFTDALTSMVRNEGSRSLFKGLLPTLGQIAPHAGIQFAVYKLFTENIMNKIDYFQRSGSVKSSLLGNLVSGSLAGFVAKTVIYPFDLVKKRLQIQGFQQYRTSFGKQMYCSGLLDCIRLTINEEGLLSLYKGYGPSMLKAVLVTALHFAVYDEIKHIMLRLR